MLNYAVIYFQALLSCQRLKLAALTYIKKMVYEFCITLSENIRGDPVKVSKKKHIRVSHFKLNLALNLLKC